MKTLAREVAFLPCIHGGEQLGGAEVEKLRRAVFENNDIVGLQVAMDDEILVCKAHGSADGLEECDALADR
jgi:hypothetical protein